jgi:putative phosphoesterase
VGLTTLRVGVLSDTHGLLRPEALEALRGADHILHAGDIGAPGLVEALGALAPVTAIRGNVDRGAWAAAYPPTATLELGGRMIHLVHDLADLDPGALESPLDVVISGHSHRPRIETRDGTLFLNPGSAGRRRFRLPVTLALLTIGPEGFSATLRTLVEQLVKPPHPLPEAVQNIR